MTKKKAVKKKVKKETCVYYFTYIPESDVYPRLKFEQTESTSYEVQTLKKELDRYQKLSNKMAKLLMELATGNDVHDKADKLVEKHFPKIYRSYV